jgi:predicted CXXCH cytochrome family protein
MNKYVVLLLLVLLPAFAAAEGKKHVKTASDQECSECHVDQAQVWEQGTHGLMNVKCVVCHGSPEVNYVAKPGNGKCRGCHDEQVDDVAKRKIKGEKTCSPCHDRHSLIVKTAPLTPFHSQGGNRP